MTPRVLRLECVGGPQDGWEFALTAEQLPMRLPGGQYEPRMLGLSRPGVTVSEEVLRWIPEPETTP